MKVLRNINDVIITENEFSLTDWGSMSDSGRIFIEIGFGNGEFLEYLAGAYPDVLIVGIEVSQLCAFKGARRALQQNLHNIKILHGDARFLLRHCFKPESAERVYMNFPCPWPKTRHASRRVTVPSFSKALNYVLSKGGVFELATDVDWYAYETEEAMKESGAFDAEPVKINPVRPYVTKYERKWKAMGKDTWHLAARKNGKVNPFGDVACAFIDNEMENWSMSAATESNKNISDVLSLLKDSSGVGTDGTGHWIFRDFFMSQDGIGLILAVTADDGFEQHFYLKFIPNRTGITVKVDSVGHPYRTPSVRAALLFALSAVK